MEVSCKIAALHTELAHSGLQLPQLSRGIYLKFFPADEPRLKQFEAAGFSWPRLLRSARSASSILPSKRAQVVSIDSKPVKLVPGARPEDIYFRVAEMIFKIVKLHKDLGQTAKCYFSKDVYSSFYPKDRHDLEYLEGAGVNWAMLLSAAGLESINFDCRDFKKNASLHFKGMSEHFGITRRHFSLFHRLLVHLDSENSDGLRKFIAETLQLPAIDDKVFRQLLADLNEFISYLRSIE